MRLIELTSFDDAALDVYARLTESQLRNRLEPAKGIFIAESPKVIRRALDAGVSPLSFLVQHDNIALVEELISAYGCDMAVYTGSAELLQQLTGFALTRGVLCAMRRPALPSVDEVLADARRVAVLDGIVDHTNVGAAFRSAAALGVDAVLVTPTCCDPLYRRAVRVSMGTVFQVPWTRLGATARDWPHAGIARLHEAGFTVAAFALCDDAVSLAEPRLADEPRLAMVFGTEGDGLAPEAIDGCDVCVRIPMEHGVDSLNVAAASAVAFWQLCGPHEGQQSAR